MEESFVKKSIQKDLEYELKINGDYLDCDDLKDIIEKKAICKIQEGKSTGTGFFCKIRNPLDHNKSLKVLLTCYHVLKIEEKKIREIAYYIKKDKKILNIENRKILYNIELDYLCIEIIETDNIDEFLEIDENFNYIELKETRIYTLGHLDTKKIDAGNIIEKQDSEYFFSHDCSTDHGWSGGPIFSKDNKVIGIHQGFNREIKKKEGIFIKYINDNIIEQYKNKYKKDIFEDFNDEKKKYIISNIIKLIKFFKKKKRNIISGVFIFLFIFIIIIAFKKNRKIEDELRKEQTNGEMPPWVDYNNKDNDSETKKYTIEKSSKYRICVYGANADPGGNGGEQCAEYYFEKGAVIEYQLGGRKSGGKGGKKCGCLKKGNGHNGAGLSYAKFSQFYIVAGGGGGDSESGNKGGDYEEDGEGKYGGHKATKNEPGKKGDKDASSEEDGQQYYGGKGRSSSNCGKYCGGGGGNGYYGGGAGDYGKKGKDGGGGGGSNYCQLAPPLNINCLSNEGGKNKFDYSSIRIYKKIPK